MPLLPLVLLLASLVCLPTAAHAEGMVVLLELKGAIGPATSDYLLKGLKKAQQQDAKLVILQMDTPGGLDSSMRAIIRAILASPIPVASYVAPGGARAASAGTYILYASHIAAMAPATNLGAATPVQIGGLPSPGEPEDEKPAQDREKQDKKDEATKDDQSAQQDSKEKPKTDQDDQGKAPKSAMERKLINDARAYIRSLAQLRDRNVEWAEQAVESAASLSANDALEKNVIDVVAKDVSDLLQKINGRVVQVAGAERTLSTGDMVVETMEPDWRNELLAIITNPQVAYILMLLGVYGLFFELSNPGALVPGVLGGICLLLALFAFQVLPINYAGLALILLGLLFMVGEAFVPSFGALGLGGIIAFVVGSLILWDETGPGYEVPMGIILGFTLTSALLLIGLGTMLVRQRRRPVVTGGEEIFQETGIVADDFDGKGQVRIHGELWQARSSCPVKKNEPVRITGRDGLVLFIEPLAKGAQKS